MVTFFAENWVDDCETSPIRKLTPRKSSVLPSRGVELGVFEHAESICEVRSAVGGPGVGELGRTAGNWEGDVVASSNRKSTPRKSSVLPSRGVELGVFEHGESICEVRSAVGGPGVGELGRTAGSLEGDVVASSNRKSTPRKSSVLPSRGVELGVFKNFESICEVRSAVGGRGVGELGRTAGGWDRCTGLGNAEGTGPSGEAVRADTSSNGMGKLALCPPGVKEGCGGDLGTIWSLTGVSARFVAEGVEGSSIADGKGASGWGRRLETDPKSPFLGGLGSLGVKGDS
jgi:hypothetical protein